MSFTVRTENSLTQKSIKVTFSLLLNKLHNCRNFFEENFDIFDSRKNVSQIVVKAMLRRFKHLIFF